MNKNFFLIFFFLIILIIPNSQAADLIFDKNITYYFNGFEEVTDIQLSGQAQPFNWTPSSAPCGNFTTRTWGFNIENSSASDDYFGNNAYGISDKMCSSLSGYHSTIWRWGFCLDPFLRCINMTGNRVLVEFWHYKNRTPDNPADIDLYFELQLNNSEGIKLGYEENLHYWGIEPIVGQPTLVENCNNTQLVDNNTAYQVALVLNSDINTYSLYVNGTCTGCCDKTIYKAGNLTFNRVDIFNYVGANFFEEWFIDNFSVSTIKGFTVEVVEEVAEENQTKDLLVGSEILLNSFSEYNEIARFFIGLLLMIVFLWQIIKLRPPLMVILLATFFFIVILIFLKLLPSWLIVLGFVLACIMLAIKVGLKMTGTID